MKTFTEYCQTTGGYWAYDLRTILNNLEPEEIQELVHDYSIEVAKESLKNASENAEAEYLCYKATIVYDDEGHSIIVNKESILSESNIPKL